MPCNKSDNVTKWSEPVTILQTVITRRRFGGNKRGFDRTVWTRVEPILLLCSTYIRVLRESASRTSSRGDTATQKRIIEPVTTANWCQLEPESTTITQRQGSSKENALSDHPSHLVRITVRRRTPVLQITLKHFDSCLSWSEQHLQCAFVVHLKDLKSLHLAMYKLLRERLSALAAHAMRACPTVQQCEQATLQTVNNVKPRNGSKSKNRSVSVEYPKRRIAPHLSFLRDSSRNSHRSGPVGHSPSELVQRTCLVLPSEPKIHDFAHLVTMM